MEEIKTITKKATVKTIDVKTNDSGAYAVITTESGNEAYSTDIAMFDNIQPGETVILTLSLETKRGKKLYTCIGCEKATDKDAEKAKTTSDKPQQAEAPKTEPKGEAKGEAKSEANKAGQTKSDTGKKAASKDEANDKFAPDVSGCDGDNLRLYRRGKDVPAEAKKPIQGGRLRGMTDINPMWRIKKLTEMFGPVGQGWTAEPIDQKMVDANGRVVDLLHPENTPNVALTGEVTIFVTIALRYKENETIGWSAPVYGSGGKKMYEKETNGMFFSDEALKGATTDAISSACKLIGIGASVYWEKDPANKY